MATEEIPYHEPHNKRRQDNDTYRDEEELEYETARRKGTVLSLVKRDAVKAMANLFSDVQEKTEKLVSETKKTAAKKSKPKASVAKKVAPKKKVKKNVSNSK